MQELTRHVINPRRNARAAISGRSECSPRTQLQTAEGYCHEQRTCRPQQTCLRPASSQNLRHGCRPRRLVRADGLVLFDRSSDVSLSLMFVTLLFVVAVLLPWTMFVVWKKFQMPYERHPEPTSFHDWRDGDFAVWGARLHGCHAAIDVLLPLIAVSFGLTAIGIVFVIVRAVSG